MQTRTLFVVALGTIAAMSLAGFYGPAIFVLGLTTVVVALGCVRINSVPPQIGVRLVHGQPVAIVNPGLALAAPYWPFEDSILVLDMKPRDFRFDNITLRAD